MHRRGFVVWLTGLPGSGKTTIATRLQEELRHRGFPVEILDGDEIRAQLSPDLGFSPADREIHNRRVIYIAKLLSRNGVAVLVPLISPIRAVRDWARTQLDPFVEVYVRASLEACIRRDPKGLYAKARRGEITDLTGLQAPYEEPLAPDVVVETESSTVDECVAMIVQRLQASGLLAQGTEVASLRHA